LYHDDINTTASVTIDVETNWPNTFRPSRPRRSANVLDGELELNAGGETRTHRVGILVALDRRVRHAISSSRGALFLLTLTAPSANAEPR